MEIIMWVDIVLIAILVVFLIIGLWKGFFDSLLGLISTGLAIVVAITCAKPASSFINKFINLPNWIDGLLSKVMAEDKVVNLFGNADLSFTRIQLANFLSIVMSAIIVFIVTKLAIWLLAKLFDSVVSESTFASGLNKVLGGIFGIVRGGALILAILLLCAVLSGTGLATPIQNTISNSKVTNYVYKYVSDFTENQLTKADIKDFVVDMVNSTQQ